MSNEMTVEKAIRDHLVCPYDKSHLVEHARMAFHLTKCEKNVSKTKLFPCPFNKMHMLNSTNMRDHIENCSDRHYFDTFKYSMAGNDPVVGANLPPLVIEDTGESWDTESSEPGQTFDLKASTAKKAGTHLFTPVGEKPSVKRMYRQQQRMEFAAKSREEQ